MRFVYKYYMPNALGQRTIKMPLGAELLHMAIQDMKIVAWFLIDTTQPTNCRRFITTGTGHRIDQKIIEHVGTVQDGPMIWHTFEVEEYQHGT